MANKSPAYRWYPRDILGSLRVAALTAAEECWYRRALDFAWLNHGIPADPIKLSRIIGKKCTAKGAQIVLALFTQSPDSPEVYISERQEIERSKQKEWSEKSAEGGRRSRPPETPNEGTKDEPPLEANAKQNGTLKFVVGSNPPEESNSTLSVDLGPGDPTVTARPQTAPAPRPEPRTLPVEIFIGLVSSGLLRRMGLKSFTPADRSEWEKFCRWAFGNNFTADDVLECYDLLKQQTWRDSAITTKTLGKELPNLNDLRHPKPNHGTNGTNGGGRYPSKRTDQDVIDESKQFIREKFGLEP